MKNKVKLLIPNHKNQFKKNMDCLIYQTSKEKNKK